MKNTETYNKASSIVQPQNILFDAPDTLSLENGQKFGPLNIRYECYGTLNSSRSNAVLVTHSFSGDAHAAGYHSYEDHKPGWWDAMIGPRKALDSERYFIICSNVLGGCMGTTGPGSINPETKRPYAMEFPVVTIQDMVQTQKLLIDHLEIQQLLAVVGGSMGGMQVLEWSIAYPKMLRAAIIIAATGKLSTRAIAFNAVGRNAIMSDPDWNSGSYYKTGKIPHRGLSIARMIGHITYISDESMNQKFGRRLQTGENFNFDFADQFQVESYLEYQGDRFVERFDANSYIYLSKAVDYYDFSSRYGSFHNSLSRTNCSFLVISYSTDWLFPSKEIKELVYAMMHKGIDVSYTELDSPYGHDAFLLETDRQGNIISSFLQSTMEKKR